MTFYCTRETDGTIHVQNVVMGHLGQHHAHDPEDFERWKAGIAESQIVWLDAAPCDCGLKPGEVWSER
jgi:hypothetical protein